MANSLLSLPDDKERTFEKVAHFLVNVADACRTANQEQRNKLANVLFEEIKVDSGGKVVAVKPRPEFKPFFKMNFEWHSKDIGWRPRGDLNP